MKLSTRIAVLILLVLSVVSTVSIAVMRVQLSKFDDAAMQQWSKTLTGTLAKSIASDTKSGNVLRVREVLDIIVAKHSAVEYVFLTDFDNRIFAYTFKDSFPDELLELTRSDADHMQSIQLNKKELHNFSYPLIDGMGAILHLGINHQQQTMLINELLRTIVLSTLLMGSIGVILSIYMSRRMTRSIELIANAIGAYGNDHSVQRINTDQDIYEASILAVAFRDMIHAQENAEKERAVSEELIERVFDTTYTLMAYLDTSFNFIRVNQAYLDADHKTAEELIGKNHFELYPSNKNEEIFKQVLLTGDAYFAQAKPFEYSYNPKQDLTHWNWSLQAVRDDGVIIALLLVLVNVTEQIEAQEAIIRNEQAMNSAQAIGHFGSWEWNISTGELSWSDEIYRIFGLTPQAISASYDTFLDAIHPDDREAVSLAVTNSVESADVPYDIEHRLLHPDGEIRYVHEQGVVYRDNGQGAIRRIGRAHV